VIDVTARAANLLAKADIAARRFDPNVCIRVIPDRVGVRFVLSEGPGSGDVVIERNGITFFVDPSLDGTVDVEEPHDHLVLRPHGPADRR
jgi:G:T-mismatch repair DNA endonuclease (very short patch repair protein)